MGTVGRGGNGGGVQEEFSFQTDGREQGEFVPASLVGVQCKSVGVPLAEVHAGGAGAPSQAPAEEAAASLTGADCGHLSDGDLTWLPGHEPVRSAPGDMWVGFPGGCGGRSSGWGTSPVETCGLAACWVGSVPTGGLNGTMTGAAGQTERSVQDSVQRAGEGADFLSGCSRAAADEQRPSDARRTAGRRCPAVAPEEHLLVRGTGVLLGDPGPVGGDHLPGLASWLHPGAWST